MRFCLFDIDGTLLASGGAGKAAMEAALREEFGVPAVVHRVSYSGRTDRAICTDLLRGHGIEPDAHNLARLTRRYLERLPGCLRQMQGRVLPGVQDLLQQLIGLPRLELGLLTGNLREGARLKLEHYGIAEFFGFGAYGDHHLERDDVARTAWDHLRRRWPQVRGEDVWVFGDTPLDIRCARTIGARVVAVATGWHPPQELQAAQPDLLLPDLSDPEPVLALVANGR